jgi:allantoinase
MVEYPDKQEDISLSLHCETAEIMAAYTKLVQDENKLDGLHAYSASRPPHSEGLAIFIASYLANETNLPNVNLLHLSSKKAVDAALQMQQVFPHINFRREVTIGHLMLDVDTETGNLAKVNPPIRPREDVEYLWESLLENNIDWVVSDHACCKHEDKIDGENPGDIWLAKSGFGGTEYLMSALVSEGSKRGLSFNKMAELTSYNPARRYGLHGKGDIDVGLDADLVLVDPNETWTIKSSESESGQGYTPFEGTELRARATTTFLRGDRIFDDHQVLGEPTGKYLKRPY